MKLMNNESCKKHNEQITIARLYHSCKAHEESFVNRVNYSRHGADGEWKLTDDSTGINNISFLSAGRRNRFFYASRMARKKKMKTNRRRSDINSARLKKNS